MTLSRTTRLAIVLLVIGAGLTAVAWNRQEHDRQQNFTRRGQIERIVGTSDRLVYAASIPPADDTLWRVAALGFAGVTLLGAGLLWVGAAPDRRSDAPPSGRAV